MPNLRLATSALLALLASAAPLAAVAAPRVRHIPDLVYSRPGGVPLQLGLVLPAPAGGPRPAVLIFHGGAWTSGGGLDGQTVCIDIGYSKS